MNDMDQQLEQDRELRNAARTLFFREMDHVKDEYSPGKLGSRMASKVGGGVESAGEMTGELVRGSSGKAIAAAAAVAGAAVLWFGRKPLQSGLAALTGRHKKQTGETIAENEPESEDAGDE